MEKHGNKVFLTPQEQRDSGYQSPINLDDFDLHGERSAADAEKDRLDALQADVGEDLLPKELHSDVVRAHARSEITRFIAREWALESAIASIPDDPSSLTQ